MTAVRGLLLAGLGAVVFGATLLVRLIDAYLSHPLAVSSTSGVRVFRLPDGSLGGFEPLVLGAEPVVVGVGLVLVVAAVFVAALQPRSRTRASTAASNAEAHTR